MARRTAPAGAVHPALLCQIVERLAPADDQLHHLVSSGAWDATSQEQELGRQADAQVSGPLTCRLIALRTNQEASILQACLPIVTGVSPIR